MHSAIVGSLPVSTRQAHAIGARAARAARAADAARSSCVARTSFPQQTALCVPGPAPSAEITAEGTTAELLRDPLSSAPSAAVQPLPWTPPHRPAPAPAAMEEQMGERGVEGRLQPHPAAADSPSRQADYHGVPVGSPQRPPTTASRLDEDAGEKGGGATAGARAPTGRRPAGCRSSARAWQAPLLTPAPLCAPRRRADLGGPTPIGTAAMPRRPTVASSAASTPRGGGHSRAGLEGSPLRGGARSPRAHGLQTFGAQYMPFAAGESSPGGEGAWGGRQGGIGQLSANRPARCLPLCCSPAFHTVHRSHLSRRPAPPSPP